MNELSEDEIAFVNKYLKGAWMADYARPRRFGTLA